MRESPACGWGAYEAERSPRVRWCSAEHLSSLSLCAHPPTSLPTFLPSKEDRHAPLKKKKKERRKKVSISSVLQIQELLTLFSHLHHFPAPPRTAHPQPPIPFSSRKGAAASACAPNPAFPIKPELRHFEMLVSALPLCSQVTQNKKKLSLPFVFVVWFLKRSVDFSA